MMTHTEIETSRARGRIAGAAAALAFVTFGLGCGAKADLESAVTSPTEPSVVVIDMTDALTFVPRSARVQVGQLVRWRNVSGVVHTVTADPALASDPVHVHLPPGAAPFDTGDIPPGLEYSRTFATPGRYEYFCIPHEAAGMLGTLEVVAPGE